MLSNVCQGLPNSDVGVAGKVLEFVGTEMSFRVIQSCTVFQVLKLHGAPSYGAPYRVRGIMWSVNACTRFEVYVISLNVNEVCPSRSDISWKIQFRLVLYVFSLF